MKKILILPDLHAPYHDKKAFELVVKVGMSQKPDTIVTLGDFADFYCVSAHDRDPNRQGNLEWEVEAANRALDALDAIKPKNKIFIAGNHENRLERYLMQKAPELFNMVKISEILKLKKRGWKYIPYRSHATVGKLNLTHDIGSAGRGAVFRAIDTFQHNIVTGHTHRMAYIVEGNAKGEAHVSCSLGWLGDSAAADYMHTVKAHRDWCLGFGFGYETKSGVVHLQPVPIVNYSCVVGGRYYKV